jgi:hypothetical protein
MGRRDHWARKTILVLGTIVLVAIMAGFGVASAQRSSRGYGDDYGQGGYGGGTGYGYSGCGYGDYCGSHASSHVAGTVYDKHAYDLAVCSGMNSTNAINSARLSGAKVTLTRFTGPSYVTVSASDPSISPNQNPETTSADGDFGWAVSAGRYRLEVSHVGYTSVTSRSAQTPPAAEYPIALLKSGDPDHVDCNATTGGSTAGGATGTTTTGTSTTGTTTTGTTTSGTTTTGGVGGSSTDGTCKVPNLIKKKKTLIRGSLAKAHCALGNLIKRHSSTKRNYVIKVSPPAGRRFVSGYKVSVVVSLGPKAKTKKKH